MKEEEKKDAMNKEKPGTTDLASERTKALIREYKRLRTYQCMLSQYAVEDLTGVSRRMQISYEKGMSVPTVKAMNRLLEPMGYQLGIVPAGRGRGKERGIQ